MKSLILLLLSCLVFISVNAQDLPKNETDTLRKDAINVFMEADDFIKNEIQFINYVRDIKVADVYIITTDETSGSGGEVKTFFIVGQGKYSGMADTLRCFSSPDETYDIRRAKAVKTLKLGLMRYVAKTPLAGFMDINFSKPMSQVVSSDKWNSWVYSASLNAYTQGQSTYNNGFLYGTLSANRITEKSKFQSNVGMEIEKDRTTYSTSDGGDTTYKSTSKYEEADILYVKSIGKHWSAGLTTTLQASTYYNYDFSMKIAPGIEYDVFPYSESTRRILTLLYQAGIEINNYTEETTRFKTEETLGYQSLSTSLSIIQKWGSVSGTLTWSNYFFDFSYYKLRFNTSASIRIFKGLSFNIYGNVAAVHDQISLPKGEASLEDVLLRRRMQKTDYSFYTSVGFTYTFGSIYNNVVNPRFGNF